LGLDDSESRTYDQLHSVPRTAERLGGISPWTVRSYLRQRKLRPTHVGRRVMVAESEILRFLKESNAANNLGETEIRGISPAGQSQKDHREQRPRKTP
jgi:hypothetical protein